MALIPNVRNLHAIFDSNLQHESKPKRLRIVYLPPAIVVGFKNPDFQTLISLFFRWCFSEDNNRVSSGPFSEKTL